MDEIGRLIHYVGAREPVDPGRMNLARERVGAHWESVAAERRAGRNRRRMLQFSLAAGIVVALGALFVVANRPEVAPLTVMATVENVLGDGLIANRDAEKGGSIAADTRISTAVDGRIALRLANGQSLRIDQASQLVVRSASHITLMAGGIYIDSDQAIAASTVQVDTPFGTARDVGTRFQVRLTDAALKIGVRSGLVEIGRNSRREFAVNEGSFLELGPSGRTGGGDLRSDDPDWLWIESIPPAFDLEGASLAQYLEWYAHELGLVLRWESNGAEQRASSVRLSGSIEGASLEEGLEIVRRIAEFDIREVDGALWISVE